MPKEKLNYERSEQRSTESQPPGSDRVEGHVWDQMQPVVSIHWSPDLHAQFGVKLDADQVSEVLKSSDGADYVEFFTPVLERRELNEAIKALRRARDQVHGADA